VTGTGPTGAGLSGQWELPPEPAQLQRGAGLVRYLGGLPARFAATAPVLLVAHLDGTVRLWDLETRRCRRELPGTGEPVHAVDLTADGRLAAACTGDAVRWWDLTTGRAARTLTVPAVLHDQPSVESDWTLRLAAGGRHLLCARGAAMVLWELPSGRVVTIHQGDRHFGFGRADLTSDGRYAVFAEARSVRVWEVATGRGWQIRDGGPTGGNDLDREPTLLRAGTGLAAAATRDHSIQLWDLAERRFVRTLIGHDGPVGALDWSVDSRVLVSAGTGHLRVWDVASGQCVRSFPHPAGGLGVWDLRLDGGARTARTVGGESVLRWWRLPRHERPARYWLSRPIAPADLADRHTQVRAWTDEAAAELAAGGYPRAHELLTRVRSTPGYERTPAVLAAWRELTRHRPRTGLRDAWPGTTLTVEHVSAADLSADGRTIAIGGVSGRLSAWDASDGTMLRRFTADRGPAGRAGVNAVALRADGRHLAVAGKDGMVALWSVATGTRLRTVATRPEPVAVRFIGDRDRVLVLHRTGAVALWDLASGTRLWVRSGTTRYDSDNLQYHSGSLWAGVPAHLAAVGQDRGRVSVVDAATGRDVHAVDTGHAMLDSVCLSTDGRLLLTVGGDPGRRTAALWETASGELLQRFGNLPQRAVLTTDARFAVTDSHHTAQVWELDTGRCLRTLEGHHAILSGLAISSDAGRVLTAALDRTVRIWELDWELSN
jgi:WD40 repeat protein